MAINVRFFLLPVVMFLLLFRNTELGYAADANAITSSKKSPRQKWLLELEGGWRGAVQGRRVLTYLHQLGPSDIMTKRTYLTTYELHDSF